MRKKYLKITQKYIEKKIFFTPSNPILIFHLVFSKKKSATQTTKKNQGIVWEINNNLDTHLMHTQQHKTHQFRYLLTFIQFITLLLCLDFVIILFAFAIFSCSNIWFESTVWKNFVTNFSILFLFLLFIYLHEMMMIYLWSGVCWKGFLWNFYRFLGKYVRNCWEGREKFVCNIIKNWIWLALIQILLNFLYFIWCWNFCCCCTRRMWIWRTRERCFVYAEAFQTTMTHDSV